MNADFIELGPSWFFPYRADLPDRALLYVSHVTVVERKSHPETLYVGARYEPIKSTGSVTNLIQLLVLVLSAGINSWVAWWG